MVSFVNVKSLSAEKVVELVAMANRNLANITNSYDVKHICKSHAIVYGLWLDDRERFGIGVFLIKGRSHDAGTVTAIQCEELEHAVAVKDFLETTVH